MNKLVFKDVQKNEANEISFTDKFAYSWTMTFEEGKILEIFWLDGEDHMLIEQESEKWMRNRASWTTTTAVTFDTLNKATHLNPIFLKVKEFTNKKWYYPKELILYKNTLDSKNKDSINLTLMYK